MKKIKIETLTELFVIGVIATGIIYLSSNHSLKSNLEISVNFAVWIALYFIQTKWLVPKYLKENNIKGHLILSVISLIICILILIPVELIYLEEMYYRRYYVVTPKIDYLLKFEWLNFDETIIGISIAFVGSIIYALFRHKKYPDNKIYRKLLPIGFLILVGVLFTGLLTYLIIGNNIESPEYDYQLTTNNDQIKFIESSENITTFNDITNCTDTNRHYKCILFWTPSCSFQSDMVERLNEIRIKIDNPNIEFIYVCGDYKDSMKKWKNNIITKDIVGYHIFLNRDEFHRIFIDDLGIKTGIVYTHLIVVNSENEIIDKNAPIPVMEEELISSLNATIPAK